MNPDSIHGGLSAKFSFTLPSFNDADYTLSAKLVGGGASTEIPSANAEGSGTAWELTVPGSLTAGLTAGSYTLLLIANDGTDDFQAGTLALTLIAATATDLRSTARKTLEAIEATLLGKADKDQASVSYNGRSISRMSWEDLQNAADRLRRKVSAEDRRAAGGGKVQSVAVRFVNA